MATEALWVQNASVTYTDAEDRHLIGAMFTQGVIGDGMLLSAGVGFAVNVSAGYAAVSDGAGGMYLAYIDTSTAVSGISTANTTYTVYLRVNKTNAVVDFVGLSSGTPSATTYAFISIGTVTTSASAISGAPVMPSSRGASLRAGGGSYLPLAGGTLSGPLTVPRLQVTNSIDAAYGGPLRAPSGVVLGYGTNPQLAFFQRASQSSSVFIQPRTWTAALLNTLDYSNNDYSSGGFNSTSHRFTTPVSGSYGMSGQAHFMAQSVSNAGRASRIVIYNPAGSVYLTKMCTQLPAGGNQDWVTWDANFDLGPGYTIEFQVWHNESGQYRLGANDMTGGAYSTGEKTYATVSLIQAF